MRLPSVLLFLCVSSFSFAGCISFNDAPKHTGETRCVKGKVIGIDAGGPDFARLSFCQDPANCPLTVLIRMDVHQRDGLEELEGKTITIKGVLNRINDHAQIVLQSPDQVLQDDAEMPGMMKAYDIDERGHYSAGTARAPRAKRTTTKKTTATVPIDIPGDVEDADPAPR